MHMSPKEPEPEPNAWPAKHPADPSDRSDEEILRDEAQTERQAPDNAGPGEAASG